MGKITRYDSVPVKKGKFTDEGYFMDTPILTSCGIFDYKNEDGSTRKELRLPKYVFDKKSLETYKG